MKNQIILNPIIVILLSILISILVVSCGIFNGVSIDDQYQSDCKNLKMNDEDYNNEYVDFIVNGHNITINHYNTEFGCGVPVKFKVKKIGSTIIVKEERKTGIFVLCLCVYDLSVTLKGIESGDYNIELWNVYDNLVATQDVVID